MGSSDGGGTGIQFVFEQIGASFEQGKCGGKRSVPNEQGVVLVMPTDGSQVTVVQGFQNQAAAVKITETVTLVHDPSMVNANCSTPKPPTPPPAGNDHH